MLFIVVRKFFNNKVVLVTGAARGIGKVIASHFLKEGALVVINDVNAVELKATRKEFGLKGYEVLAIKADLTKEKDCHDLIKAIIKEHGRLDILINNAGRGFRGLFEKTPLDVFHKIMKTNFETAVNCTSAALSEIKKSKGSIVFLSSVAAVRGLPAYGPYAVSKVAIKSFAQLLRTELHGTGVHIGLLIIGPVETDKGKRITLHDGESATVRKMNIFTPKKKVANRVLRMVKRRRFIMRINMLTRAIALLHFCCPWLLERILIRMKNPNNFK